METDSNFDTTIFWRIIDYAFERTKYNNALKEASILNQLIKLTPEEIVDFEIVFQDVQIKASTYINLAAATIMNTYASDDTFFYFRCWLISLGSYNFYKIQNNVDYLAVLNIPIPSDGFYHFETLISLSDSAYEIVTQKKEDETFPRNVADKRGLFYDTGRKPKGKEWEDVELPTIAPFLFRKYCK